MMSEADGDGPTTSLVRGPAEGLPVVGNTDGTDVDETAVGVNNVGR